MFHWFTGDLIDKVLNDKVLNIGQEIAAAADASLWQRFQSGLRETVGPTLKALQQPVDDWLGGLPMWIAVACAVGLYVVALFWTWALSRDFVYRGAPDQKRWRDLRIWATLVILPYIAVYLWLGR
jgi:hypothetical protein